MSKACTKCGKEKPLDKFDFKHRVAKNGTHHFYGMCRKCRNAKIMEWHKKNPKKVTLAQQKYAENNREKLSRRTREWNVANRFRRALNASRATAKRRNHLSCDATVRELEVAFTGRCAVCGVWESECSKRLHMDHDYATGKFRGWLCGQCNAALGLLQDSREVISDLLKYISDKE